MDGPTDEQIHGQIETNRQKDEGRDGPFHRDDTEGQSKMRLYETRLDIARVGLYLRSLDHLGRSSEVVVVVVGINVVIAILSNCIPKSPKHVTERESESMKEIF